MMKKQARVCRQARNSACINIFIHLVPLHPCLLLAPAPAAVCYTIHSLYRHWGYKGSRCLAKSQMLACAAPASDKEAANPQCSQCLKQPSLSPKHPRYFAQWPVRPVRRQSSHPPFLSRIVAASNARRRTSGPIVWPFRPGLVFFLRLPCGVGASDASMFHGAMPLTTTRRRRQRRAADPSMGADAARFHTACACAAADINVASMFRLTSCCTLKLRR